MALAIGTIDLVDRPKLWDGPPQCHCFQAEVEASGESAQKGAGPACSSTHPMAGTSVCTLLVAGWRSLLVAVGLDGTSGTRPEITDEGRWSIKHFPAGMARATAATQLQSI